MRIEYISEKTASNASLAAALGHKVTITKQNKKGCYIDFDFVTYPKILSHMKNKGYPLEFREFTEPKLFSEKKI